MKKLVFTLAVAALLASVSSCTKEKEGVYNPKQKIQSVYLETKGYQENELVLDNPKFKSEVWAWNDNRLERISYYDQATYYDESSTYTERELIYTQLFSYDKNDRLTKCEILGDLNMVATYTYDGNYLETITISEEDSPMVSYHFNREKKKVTSIDMTINSELLEKSVRNTKTAKMLDRTNPLRFVMTPELAAHTMSATKDYAIRMAKKGCTKAESTFTLTVEWDGDNISKISGTIMDMNAVLNFKYDNKNNPFYGLFDMSGVMEESMVFGPVLPMNKHNVTRIALSYTYGDESETESQDYSYTYNGKDYPTSKTIDETMPMTDWVYDEESGEWVIVELGNYRFVQTEYYEY